MTSTHPSTSVRRHHRLRSGIGAVTAALLGLGALGAVPAGAAAAERLPLPDGFQPEGITTGGDQAWLGSLRDGSIYRLDLATGEGETVSGPQGGPSVGLKRDARGRLFVAGGDTGQVRVVDSETGEVLRRYRPGVGETFVNDVVLAGGSAWFTDSAAPVVYRLPLGRAGALPRAGAFERIRLRGDWRQPTGDGAFGANGISTTVGGRSLLVVNSTSGELFRVNPDTGRARTVDVRGAGLTAGDGMLRTGTSLYVVRNRLNRVVELRLRDAGLRAVRRRTISAPAFDVPTTIARSGAGLYLPNARFDTDPTPTTPYDVIRVPAQR